MEELETHPSRLVKTQTSLAENTAGMSAEQRRWAGSVASAASGLGLATGAYLCAQSQPALRRLGLLALGASTVGGLARWQFGRAFNWQPTYKVEARVGRLEVRRYQPAIHAVTVVVEQWEQSLEQGFMRLAAYISGANARGTRIPMTSPVFSSIAPHLPSPQSSTTSPEASDESEARAGVLPVAELMALGPRQVDFVMPGGLTFSDLPNPDDRRVRVVRVPERRVAALGFRGRYGGDSPAHKRNELLFLAKLAGLNPRSEVRFAGYDAPFTLPVLRRNEVMVELD